jgi:hypothetical protein
MLGVGSLAAGVAIRALDVVDGGCVATCNATSCTDTCETECSPFCRYSMIGDSVCDSSCDNENCQFDGGDCAQMEDSLYRTITIVGFCLIASIFVWYFSLSLCLILFLYVRRNRFRVDLEDENARELSSDSHRPITIELIDQVFPKVTFAMALLDFAEPVCVICLDE